MLPIGILNENKCENGEQSLRMQISLQPDQKKTLDKENNQTVRYIQ